MSNYDEITSPQTDAKSPVNELLMQGDEGLITGGVRHNFINHEDRLAVLEAASGGSGGVEEVSALKADLLTDPRFATDVGVDFRNRHHVLQHKLGTKTTSQLGSKLGENIEGNEEDTRFTISTNNNGERNDVTGGNSEYYRQYSLLIDKDSDMSFKMKRGENYFGIGAGEVSGSRCDKVEIYIDGQTPTALGLLDENGNPAPNFITTNHPATKYQVLFWFYGLDAEEHVITVKNNDSASKTFSFNFIDVGYMSRDFTIDNTIHVNDLKCLVGGIEADVAATDLTFAESVGHGHTGMIAVDSAGAVRAVDGIESAQTQIRADQTIDFTAAVTTLPCKNVNWFPDDGICIATHPNGGFYPFSYNAKTDTPVQTQSLDGIVWQLRPDHSLDIEQGFFFTGGGKDGLAKYNMNIVYWAKAPIEIDTNNNKIDFSVTINGTTTTHIATIPSGFYSGDLVDLGPAITKAMETAKSLSAVNGKYYARWSESDKKWSIGASGNQVTELGLLFSTGASLANSVHATLGYASNDLASAVLYTANTETKHKAQRALYADKNLNTSLENEVMFNSSSQNDTQDTLAATKYGAVYRTINTSNQNVIEISCDRDASGMIIYLLDRDDGLEYGVHVQIDEYEDLWIRDSIPSSVGSGNHGLAQIRPILISFPRGSKKIRLKDMRLAPHASNTGPAASSAISYMGYRNLYSRANIEELTDDEKILQVYNVAPKRLFGTDHANVAGALYSAGNGDPAKDDIDSLTESAGWTASGFGTYWNGYVRTNSATGAYIDIEFTVDEGGGCYPIFYRYTGSGMMEMYLTQAASIVEGTDFISSTTTYSYTTHHESYTKPIGIMGLKAGQYIMRIKSAEPSASYNIHLSGICIVTGRQPDPENYVKEQLANTGQGLSYPLNYSAEQLFFSSMDRVYSSARNTDIVEQRLSKTNYYVNSSSQIVDRSFNILIHQENTFNGSYMNTPVNGDYISINTIMRGFSMQAQQRYDDSTLLTAFFGGIQTPLTTDGSNCVKGGNANSVYNEASVPMSHVCIRACTMSGVVVTLPDTRGLRVGQRVQLIDNVLATENAYILSIVANTSFTITSALTVITDSNVESVDFSGIHSARLRNDQTTSYGFSVLKVEPLPLSPSKFLIHHQAESHLETATNMSYVTSGGYIAMPVFSDGTTATFEESSFEIINKTSGGATWDMYDFPRFVCSAGNFHIKVTAQRMVDKAIKEQDWSW